MSASTGLCDVQRRIDDVQRFLTSTLKVSNAHTMDFYTNDVWKRFIAVSPEDVLSALSSSGDRKVAPRIQHEGHSGSTFGFCNRSQRLVDPQQLLQGARAHSLPSLGLCQSREEFLQTIRRHQQQEPLTQMGPELEPDDFMNSKKSHEVQSMSEVVAALAARCRVKQVIDLGSGKGYLSSFLSLQFGLQVFGIDSSSTNTRGAQERNRKLKKFSRMYQKKRSPASPQAVEEVSSGLAAVRVVCEEDRDREEEAACTPAENFFSASALDVVETPRSPRVKLTDEERERRKKESLERKSQSSSSGSGSVFSPVTSHVTAQTKLQELLCDLEEAVMVGLHTCGDLAASTLRIFVAQAPVSAVCSVGCCYNLMSEEFDPDAQDGPQSVYGFPMSQYVRQRSWFCGRNARLSACLSLERVSHGQGIQMESLFYRAVLHVIIRDHYSPFRSRKRVGTIYSKSSSFVDYVRRALHRLELDHAKLSDREIQQYLDTYSPRRSEMDAFNMLKVTLAPCIEGLVLLDRLCYLREQESVSFSSLVQLFDPLLSPRCYAVVGLKAPRVCGGHLDLS
ncbi:putative methyltransferase-like protein 25 isoform 1-T2 [Synchiropus picturatus]